MEETMATTERTDEQVGNWGRWGAGDERGTLNLLTDETVLNATRVCKTGKVYRLGLPIQREGVPIFAYRGAPQRLTLTSQTDTMLAAYGAEEGVGANEDVLVMASHSITHMDALCHVFADRKHYNGFSCDSFESYAGAPHCGIDKTNGFAGRAVLLDLPGHLGVDWLTPGQPIGSDDLEACRAAQGTEVHPGDILLVRTGWLSWYRTLDAAARHDASVALVMCGLRPGRASARWLWDHRVAAVAADNPGLEAMPASRVLSPEDRRRLDEDPGSFDELLLHGALLPMLGMPIG
jgi:kynurenine formamidase